ncbi:unnamed protein product [Onchocerca ochengi]|uniref:G_PROTEIN_RECEP_F1_2 domain-containing protein n=1 Tax=Onchocerca ochengi TaxID=42157 RepID=A0A182EE78_ONCOC|nr:unnamed protein product [Onchocerca ochengi]
MRTFTNKLLTSLATADFLVGLFVMPLSLLDLLLDHAWPFDMLLCQIWSTSDVLFCTASILNLCVISIDRYLAISDPLKYSRTRNRKTAALLLGSVWLISLMVCSTPWVFHFDDYYTTTDVNISEATSCLNTIVCGYPSGIMYRIYSSMASFFIPLLLMCSVYWKIFRIVSTREKLLWKSINMKSFDKCNTTIQTCGSQIRDRNSSYSPNGMLYSEEESMSEKRATHDYSVISVGSPTHRMDTDDGKLARIAQNCHLKLQPRYLLAKAHDRYQTSGPGKFTTNSRILNPVIYTMYNHDFRRCFRDLLTLGFMRKRRTMSIRKLHQQSNC